MFAYSVALTVISCGGMGYALFGRDQPAPLMTTFFAFCYFWYGLSPIMSLEFGAFPGGSTYTDHDIVYAYQVVIIGIAYYVGGYALGRKHRSRNVGTVDRASPTDWDRRLQLIAAAAIGMSLSAWWSLGGFAVDLLHPTRSRGTAPELGPNRGTCSLGANHGGHASPTCPSSGRSDCNEETGFRPRPPSGHARRTRPDQLAGQQSIFHAATMGWSGGCRDRTALFPSRKELDSHSCLPSPVFLSSTPPLTDFVEVLL